MTDTVKLLIFSVVLFAVAHLAMYLFHVDFLLIILLSIYFTGFSWLFNRQLQKAYDDENKNKFTQVFMGLSGIKILTSLILLVAFLYFFNDHRFNTGIYTMSYYMLYTVYEVIFWRSKLKV